MSSEHASDNTIDREKASVTDSAPGIDRWTRRVELISALLLSLAAVGAAWSGYQAARWSGSQAVATADANASRLESSRSQTRGGQLVQIDVALFFQAVNAFAAGNEDLLAFYTERFRDEFVPVFNEWTALDPLNNPGAPLSPFDLDSYRPLALEDAARLSEEADAFVADSHVARSNAQRYTIALGLLASAMFFAGISTKFSSHRARISTLVPGAVLFIGVAVWIGVLPRSVGL